MRQDTEDFIEYLEANPQLRPWQAICDYFGYDIVLGWKIPESFSEEDKQNQLEALSEIGIEDTFYL